MSLAQLSVDEITTMRVADLKHHLRELKLPQQGNKPELQKRLTDALMAPKQATADTNDNNNNDNPKKSASSSASTSAPASASAAPVNKSSESNNNLPPSSSESNAQRKNTNETTSTNAEEKNNASTETAHADEDADKVPDSTGNQNDKDESEKQSAPHQKKLSNIKRIEVEGLPEELLVWETEEISTTGKRSNGISRNLGVTTAELVLQRQERIKKYGLQSMPEQVKRMLRKERFNRNSNDNNPNKSQNNEEKATNTTSNDTNAQSDFSIQSVLASDGASEGLTREKLSQRKKRFGDVAIQNAFQESQQRTFENRNRNRDQRNRNRNQSYNNNNNRNNNNNNAAAMNRSGNIRRNRDQNILDDRIRARMDRFGTKPPRENSNRRDFDRDWNSMDRKAPRHQDRYRTSRRNNRDRSRSRQRKRENESSRLDEELDNAVESIIHSATKAGEIIKDFGSDDEFVPTAEDLERMEQRKKRFEG